MINSFTLTTTTHLYYLERFIITQNQGKYTMSYNQYLNHPEVRKVKDYFSSSILNGGDRPPAITIGLVAFLIMIWVVSFFNPDLIENWALYPTSLTSFQLNRISLYPLVHGSFFHLFLNVVSIISPLSTFERNNGTVHTGVVLNVLAVVTGVAYAIVGLAFYPDIAVIGASGWCFSFYSYYAYKQSLVHPITQFNANISFPTMYTPMALLIVIGILVPNSSFVGHLFGILAGYALGYGLLDPLLTPPFNAVNRIEHYVSKGIDFISKDFHYVRETEGKELRAAGHAVEVLPLHATAVASGEIGTGAFQGQGQTLGTTTS